MGDPAPRSIPAQPTTPSTHAAPAHRPLPSRFSLLLHALAPLRFCISLLFPLPSPLPHSTHSSQLTPSPIPSHLPTSSVHYLSTFANPISDAHRLPPPLVPIPDFSHGSLLSARASLNPPLPPPASPLASRHRQSEPTTMSSAQTAFPEPPEGREPTTNHDVRLNLRPCRACGTTPQPPGIPGTRTSGTPPHPMHHPAPLRSHFPPLPHPPSHPPPPLTPLPSALSPSSLVPHPPENPAQAISGQPPPLAAHPPGRNPSCSLA